MKSTQTMPRKKHNCSARLFIDAVTYRVPLLVTKVMAYANTTYPVCPRCAMSLDREYMNFCDRCGQKLNWIFFEYARIIYPENQGD